MVATTTGSVVAVGVGIVDDGDVLNDVASAGDTTTDAGESGAVAASCSALEFARSGDDGFFVKDVAAVLLPGVEAATGTADFDLWADEDAAVSFPDVVVASTGVVSGVVVAAVSLSAVSVVDPVVSAGEDGVEEVESPPMPESVTLNVLLYFFESDGAVDEVLSAADFAVFSPARALDEVEDRSSDDPVDDGRAADELADTPDEPAPAFVDAPSSAYATPDPLARAAPIPSVSALAPSHAYGSIRRRSCWRSRSLLPLVFVPDPPRPRCRTATCHPDL